MYRIILIFSLISCLFISAQDTLMPVIFLDDVVISEKNNGFSVEEFVEYVKKDTTFYMGFKNMRYYSHFFESELSIFNKKGEVIGMLKKKGNHHSNGKQAWIVFDSIFDKGKIFKRNGKYKYYTPEAFDEVFFPKDTINVSLNMLKEKNQKESQNMRDAKTVGFSIGTDDVSKSKGGISKKLAIFDINMHQYYDYSISDTIYNNKKCYVFIVKVKEELKAKDREKALIRKIVSYFDKENFNVIYRKYKFVYNHLLIDLDMEVVVQLDYVNGKHVPTYINYRGFWNVPFFKAERAEFKLKNTNYMVN